MSLAIEQDQLERMSVSERLELIGRIWDSIPDSEIQIPEWHLREVARRLAASDRDPGRAVPLADAKQRLMRRG